MRAGQWIKHERLDDEVMVIDLNSGAYFSFVGAAADVWSLVTSGYDAGAASDLVAARYSADPASVRTDVSQFLTELGEQGLLSDAPAEAGAVPDVPPVELGPATAAYETPHLERYDDLADLLLLDPVHEVDPVGWPAGKPQ